MKELNKNKAINSYNNNYETLNNTTVNENTNNSDYYTKNDFASSQANVSNVEQTNKFNSSTTSIEITTEKEVNKAKFPDLRVIGQFSKTYILAEYLDTLYIIDQHAAHEKILYEKYLKDIESNEIIVQQLLIPCIIDLSLDDYECYKENIDIFTNSGFVIEEFGGNTIALKEVPYIFRKTR